MPIRYHNLHLSISPAVIKRDAVAEEECLLGGPHDGIAENLSTKPGARTIG